MKAENIEIILRRASRSNLAKQMAFYQFPFRVKTLTISENAPASIKLNGYYPAQLGFIKINRELGKNEFNNPSKWDGDKVYHVWIKTATLGGKSAAWIRILN